MLSQPLDVNLELVDMTGKTMMAIDIFAAVIAYMKKHFLEKVHGEHKAILLKAEDVHFILTVPAIWSDLSKGFMRKAAVKVIYLLSLRLGEPYLSGLFLDKHDVDHIVKYTM